MKGRITNLNRLTYAQKSELLDIGQRMSNWCYNIKQEIEVPPRIQKEAEELQKMWDKARKSA